MLGNEQTLVGDETSPAAQGEVGANGLGDAVPESIRAARAAKTYEAILREARSAIADGSFEKASLRQICRQVGVTKGALYHHFRDKRDLFERVFELVCDEVFAEVVEQAADTTSGRPNLRAQAWAFVKAASHPTRIAILNDCAPAVLGPDRFTHIVRRWPALRHSTYMGTELDARSPTPALRTAVAALLETAGCRAEKCGTEEDLRVVAHYWAVCLDG